MRAWPFKILSAVSSIVALFALAWHQLIPRGMSTKRQLVENSTPDARPDGPGETARPRLFVLAINGGASPRKNFFSPSSCICRNWWNLLHTAGVPSDRITVLAGDGNDPESRIFVLREEGLGPDAWRLTEPEAGHGEADQFFIDPVECIDCGACVPVCPVSAIFAQDDLPEKWAHFTEKNAKHFGR